MAVPYPLPVKLILSQRNDPKAEYDGHLIPWLESQLYFRGRTMWYFRRQRKWNILDYDSEQERSNCEPDYGRSARTMGGAAKKGNRELLRLSPQKN